MEFKRDLSKPENREYWELIQTIDPIIPADSVKAYYPLNLYSRKQDLKLFLFTEKDIWIIEQLGWSLKIILHKNFQVETVNRDFHTRNRFEGSELSISLRGGEILKFNSKTDGPNEDWTDTYSEYINNIFNFIVKAP